jgi:leucyl/phenylalanyl-tRNA---protein transferase
VVPWLKQTDPFPPPSSALASPNGLLAAGGDLSPRRLIEAYRLGIFPWYSEGEPILWWSPDPRMVLVPTDLKIARSLGKTLKRGGFQIRADTAFREVIQACATARRPGQRGTWITRPMVEAYCRLHELGVAHSVETWIEGELAGGLYGIALGRAFFGESMFARSSDASKIAFVHLVRQLERWDFGLIDCQMSTAHLASFGAAEIARREFSARLAKLVHYAHSTARWCFEPDSP